MLKIELLSRKIVYKCNFAVIHLKSKTQKIVRKCVILCIKAQYREKMFYLHENLYY